jgi:hypothetical protein
MLRRSVLHWLMGASLAFAACGSGGNAGDDDTSVADASTPVADASGAADAFVPPADSYSLTWGPVTAAPGEEHTQCVTLNLNNAPRIHVGKIHNELANGSHHLIVYRTTTPGSATPVECAPFADTLAVEKGSPLMITQKHDELLELPEGVAFTLEPNQLIRLEMHYINTGDVTEEVKATTTFIPIADAEFEQEADFLFIGTPDITIPAAASVTVGPTFFQLPTLLVNANFFALTGHTHKFGTNVHVATATNANDTGVSVYDVANWLWNEPETTYFDPTFKVPANGGFRFSCDYKNTSASSVGFGESAKDEMCFFWAYYYPSAGAKVCIKSSRFPIPINVCCPDPSQEQICSAIAAYLQP